MNLVVPAARLYTREVNTAISACLKNSKLAHISSALKHELEHWRFIDTWTGFVPLRSEHHKQLVLATDASGYKYGVKLLSG